MDAVLALRPGGHGVLFRTRNELPHDSVTHGFSMR
jgi:hypothetical protein